MPRKSAQDAAPEPKKRRTKKPLSPLPPGRPGEYSQELADRICARLADGTSLRTVCKADDMPHVATIFKWMREHPEFNEQYGKAKQEAADALVEEMIDIADDGTNDWMEVHDKDGNCTGYKVNGEHVQRSRLRVETRKWIAAKLKPKKYGERIDVDHGVQEDNPLAGLLKQVAGATLKPKQQDDDNG
ncbi:hypothetical protein D3C76_47880 [compost metagenome]